MPVGWCASRVRRSGDGYAATWIATAKANGIEPHAWLTDVLTRLPTTRDHDIDSLLPLA